MCLTDMHITQTVWVLLFLKSGDKKGDQVIKFPLSHCSD